MTHNYRIYISVDRCLPTVKLRIILEMSAEPVLTLPLQTFNKPRRKSLKMKILYR